MKKFLCLIVVISLIGIGSCKKKNTDPDICDGLWETALVDEVMAMYNASVAYGLNPNTTTCNAYKASVQAYLDELEKYSNCNDWLAADKAALAEAIDEAEEELANACQ